MYRRYAEKRGALVTLVPGKAVGGMACLDLSAKRGIIFQGSQTGITGTVQVDLHNLPTSILDTGKMTVSIATTPEIMIEYGIF